MCEKNCILREKDGENRKALQNETQKRRREQNKSKHFYSANFKIEPDLLVILSETAVAAMGYRDGPSSGCCAARG